METGVVISIDSVSAPRTRSLGSSTDEGAYRDPRWALQLGLPLATDAAEARSTGRKLEATHMTVKFFPNDKGNPPGKLADAELHFSGGPLDGLKLVGFAVWERKTGGRNVTVPARQYSVNGERRSYALLRPILDQSAQDRLRDLVLEAYREHEESMAEAV
jgi:hypothetical protein